MKRILQYLSIIVMLCLFGTGNMYAGASYYHGKVSAKSTGHGKVYVKDLYDCEVYEGEFYEPDSKDYQTEITIPANEESVPACAGFRFFAKAETGYRFAGWYKDENCSIPYNENNVVDEIGIYSDNSNTTSPFAIYAKFVEGNEPEQSVPTTTTLDFNAFYNNSQRPNAVKLTFANSYNGSGTGHFVGSKLKLYDDGDGNFVVAPTIAGLEIMAPENCYGLFAGQYNLKSIDFTNFNTENVKNMSYIFYCCSDLESLDLSGFNTNKVTDMSYMFYCCTSLESLDLSGFNTNKVTNMSQMFVACNNLKSLDLSSFNTSEVTDMDIMFAACSELLKLTIGNFDMSNVSNNHVEGQDAGMFGDCDKLKTLTLKAVPYLAGESFDDKFTGEGVTVNYQLDDNSYIHTGSNNYLPAATTDPTYTRTMKNQWGTIVLPFDVTISSGNPYDFYKIDKVEGDVLNLSKMSGTIPAGTPALIRIYSDKVNGKTYDLCLTAADNNVSVSGSLTQSANDLSLVGSYNYMDITAKNGYIISNNAFWSIQDVKGENKVYCAPFRAYISADANLSRLRIGTVEDETTGIAALDALNSADAEYYDINGRKQTDLRQGVNLIKINGKTTKVIVK